LIHFFSYFWHSYPEDINKIIKEGEKKLIDKIKENKDLESKLVRPNCTYEITEREIEVEYEYGDEKHPHKVCA